MMVGGRSIWLASLMMAVLAAGGARAQTSPAAGGTALLRINCEGDSDGADVTLNDDFKGACPLDVSVPAGTVRLRAVKPEGELRERVLEQEFRIGSGVVKKIELEMPASQLNARGQKLEKARIQEEQARKLQAAEEQRQLAEAKALEDTRKAAAAAELLARLPAQLDKNIDVMLQARRKALGSEGSPCPDCPAKFVGPDGVKAEFPTTTDKAFKLFLDRPKANALRYLATNGEEFYPPAVSSPLPCESAGVAMRKLTPPLANFADLSALQKASRDQKYPNEPRQYIRDVKIWPVVATCMNDVLDGPLDFWMFANVVQGDRNASGPFMRVRPSLVHVQATMSGGASIGPFTISKRVGIEMVGFYDPATGQLLRHNIIGAGHEYALFTSLYPQEAENLTIYEITVEREENADKRGDKDFNPKSEYVRPFSGAVLEKDVYRADSRLAHYFIKDGQIHGEFTMFSHVYLGKNIGKSVKCYRNGVEIEMKPCVVD